MMSGWQWLFGGGKTCWFCTTPLSRWWLQSIWQEICPACQERFVRIIKWGCDRCGRPAEAGAANPCDDCRCAEIPLINRSVVAYSPSVKRVIWQLKYQGLERLAEPLGRMMAERAIDCYGRRNFLISWVPLSVQRLKWRGFNQAELLARVVARELGWPCQPLLHRRHTAQAQIQKARQERLRSLQGAFSLLPSLVGHRWTQPILLIDDVYTTGATLRECAKPLLEAGVEQVYALTFARA